MTAQEAIAIIGKHAAPISARELADLTGATRTSCSSMLRELSERGLLETSRRYEGSYERVRYALNELGQRFCRGELQDLPPSHRARARVVETPFCFGETDWPSLYRFAGLL